MTRHLTFTLITFLALAACNQTSQVQDKYDFDINYDSLTFNQGQWTISDNDNWNSWYRREYMMKDLLANHLKQGMAKNEILNLLGQPYTYPATYVFSPALDTNGIAYKIYQDSLDKWLSQQYNSTIPLLKYNRGFSGSGPNLFIIVLDKDDKAVDFLTADAI